MILKIEDVKAGDKLECIDHDGYLDSVNENALDLTSIVIRGVDHNLSLFLTEGKGQGKSIKFSDIKYFKKKEQSQQYTFDDLIDVAVQAKKDGILKYLRITDDTVIINTTDRKSLRTSYDNPLKPSQYEGYINYIQSLYKETFVIECEEDLRCIKKGAKILLLNGNSLEVMYVNLQELHVAPVADYRSLDILSLKGATVEQERSRS